MGEEKYQHGVILLSNNVERELKERETSSSMEWLFQEASVWLINSEKLRKLDLIKKQNIIGYHDQVITKMIGNF